MDHISIEVRFFLGLRQRCTSHESNLLTVWVDSNNLKNACQRLSQISNLIQSNRTATPSK